MSLDLIASALQLLVGLGLLNVWLMRARSSTSYRGGRARTLREEFEVYGLPAGAFYVVGGLKIAAAVVLIAGIWIPLPVRIAAAIVVALMLGAIAMHVRVKDPVGRSVPAILILVMSVTIIALR